MADTTDNPNALSRRDFLKTTSAATTVGAVAGSLLAGQARPASAALATAKAPVIGANDRVRYAIVGTKGMGGGHLKILVEEMKDANVEVVAVCDVWEKARLRAKEGAGIDDKAVFTDYRKMLEMKDIDVVVIATPDQTHAQIAIDSMESGRHIYLEKPMTRYLDEAFDVYDVAKKTGASVQVGAHGCSDPKWLKAREVLRSGRLGKLLWSQGSYCRNNPAGEWNYELDPDANASTVDWKAWLGPAKNRPWSAERYFRWRKFWDYGNGVIGDLWPHRLHPLLMAMDMKDFPLYVSCIGGDLCHTDAGPGPDGKPYGEPRDVADVTMMTCQFPDGQMTFLAGSTTNERGVEDLIRGQKANLVLGGGMVLVEPERPFSDEIERVDETPADSGESHTKHQMNFLNALRNNEPPSCNIDLAIRVQTIVSMAETAYRKGTQMKFDPARRKMSRA